jgi:hypothetical protein
LEGIERREKIKYKNNNEVDVREMGKPINSRWMILA